MSTEPVLTERDGGAATRLQILATEHWSLLATRTLTYTESMNRVTIFLAILSGAVVALALIAQADHFGSAFVSIAIPMLLVVLYAGMATVARLMTLNGDDYRWVVGMNRLRQAYLELHPDLERNLVTSPYDDLPGALQTLGIDRTSGRAGVGSVFHQVQTLPGMLSVIVAAVAGAIGALVARAFDAPPTGMIITAAGAFVFMVLFMAIWARRSYRQLPPMLEPRFPSPTR